jgi:hypothetical protein
MHFPFSLLHLIEQFGLSILETKQQERLLGGGAS